MLIPEDVIKRLKANWGEKADTCNCYAELKLIDPMSSWCCYVFAMDEAQENIHCVLFTNTLGVEICQLGLSEIEAMYNFHGDPPMIDNEFVRKKVNNIIEGLT